MPATTIVVAVIAVYWNSLGVPFLLDDEISIVDNPSLTSLRTAFFPSNEVYTGGRPLLNLSFALNHLTSGGGVRGYHVTNLLIHALAALTLFALVRRTLALESADRRLRQGADPIAFGAVLLWALHPLQTESVTYISQRAESLMGLFYLLTLYAFIRAASFPQRWWGALAIFSCIAGMLVKEVTVTAPVVILLFDRVFLAGSFQELWRRRRWLHLGLAASWVVLALTMLGTRIHVRGIGYGFDFNWSQYLRIECLTVLQYLRLAVWPGTLTFDYGTEVPLPGAGTLTACLLGLGILAGLMAAGWRRHAPSVFLAGCFFLILAPTSSIVPVAGQPIAENRVYLPLAAVAILASIGIFRVSAQRSVFVLLLGATALGAATVARNRTYDSALRIWTDTVRKLPGSSRAHLYLGTALVRAGQRSEAIGHLEEAVRLRPSYSFAHLNLASAYFLEHRNEDALRHYAIAVKLKPDDHIAQSNFGSALFAAGQKDAAIERFNTSLRLRPDYAEARVNLGITLAHLGRFDEAVAAFQETLRLHPGHAGASSQLRQVEEFRRGAAPPRP